MTSSHIRRSEKVYMVHINIKYFFVSRTTLYIFSRLFHPTLSNIKIHFNVHVFLTNNYTHHTILQGVTFSWPECNIADISIFFGNVVTLIRSILCHLISHFSRCHRQYIYEIYIRKNVEQKMYPLPQLPFLFLFPFIYISLFFFSFDKF